jgi:hypothetical protein
VACTALRLPNSAPRLKCSPSTSRPGPPGQDRELVQPGRLLDQERGALRVGVESSTTASTRPASRSPVLRRMELTPTSCP